MSLFRRRRGGAKTVRNSPPIRVTPRREPSVKVRVPGKPPGPGETLWVTMVLVCHCGVEFDARIKPGGEPWTCPNRRCRRNVRILSVEFDGADAVIEVDS